MLCFNGALLHKWQWKYALERKSVWRKVIDSKYGKDMIRNCSRDEALIPVKTWIISFGRHKKTIPI